MPDYAAFAAEVMRLDGWDADPARGTAEIVKGAWRITFEYGDDGSTFVAYRDGAERQTRRAVRLIDIAMEGRRLVELAVGDATWRSEPDEMEVMLLALEADGWEVSFRKFSATRILGKVEVYATHDKGTGLWAFSLREHGEDESGTVLRVPPAEAQEAARRVVRAVCALQEIPLPPPPPPRRSRREVEDPSAFLHAVGRMPVGSWHYPIRHEFLEEIRDARRCAARARKREVEAGDSVNKTWGSTARQEEDVEDALTTLFEQKMEERRWTT